MCIMTKSMDVSLNQQAPKRKKGNEEGKVQVKLELGHRGGEFGVPRGGRKIEK